MSTLTTRWQRIVRRAGAGLIAHMRRARKPDFVVGEPDDPYLERWWLLPRNSIFNVYLHHFTHSDDDRALHDHPWPYLSLMLRGRYRELMPDGVSAKVHAAMDKGEQRAHTKVVTREIGSFAARSPRHVHRIEIIDGRSCWTLFLTGPRLRHWGFWCKHGWVPWEQFTAPGAPGQVGRGCGEMPRIKA